MVTTTLTAKSAHIYRVLSITRANTSVLSVHVTTALSMPRPEMFSMARRLVHSDVIEIEVRDGGVWAVGRRALG